MVSLGQGAQIGCWARTPSAAPGPHRCVCAPAHRSLYNNIKTPGQLQPSATFYLFKTGIEPKWEDPKNTNGGCWTAALNRGGNSKTQIDAWWLNSVRRLLAAVSLAHPCPA